MSWEKLSKEEMGKTLSSLYKAGYMKDHVTILVAKRPDETRYDIHVNGEFATRLSTAYFGPSGVRSIKEAKEFAEKNYF
jgi:hypothetical protein